MRKKLKIHEEVREMIERVRDDIESAGLDLERILHGLTITERVDDDVTMQLTDDEIIELYTITSTLTLSENLTQKIRDARWGKE